MVFKKGEINNPKGRERGSKNKYTLAKELILQTLLDRKSELKTMPLSKIVQFVAQTTPKEHAVEVNTPIIVKWEK